MSLKEEQKATIINEVVQPSERVTGAEFVRRLLDRMLEAENVDKAKEYAEVIYEFGQAEKRKTGQAEMGKNVRPFLKKEDIAKWKK